MPSSFYAAHALQPPEPPGPDGRLFDLQGYSYSERATLLPVLTTAFTHCGG